MGPFEKLMGYAYMRTLLMGSVDLLKHFYGPEDRNSSAPIRDRERQARAGM